jgi:hypothetical protein
LSLHIRAGALLALAVLAGCSTDPISAETLKSALKMDESDVLIEAYCNIAARDLKTQQDTPPDTCVYVQTADSLNFLQWNLDAAQLEPVFTLPISELTGVSLARYVTNRQVQLHHGDEVIAIQLTGDAFVKAALTEEVYTRLTAAGVPAREPVEWINMVDVRMPVTIPVYIPN